MYPRESFSVHQNGLHELLKACLELEPRPEVVVYGIVPKETTLMSMDLTDPVAKQLPVVVSHVMSEVTSDHRMVSNLDGAFRSSHWR